MSIFKNDILNIKFTFFFSLWVCLPLMSLCESNSVLNITPQITQAYYQATSLRLDESQKTLQNIRQQDPNNAMVFYIENYIDFFTVFIKEEKKDYLNLLKNIDRRLEIIAQSDPSSPYYLFCQAEIILQLATVKLKFDDKVSAANDVYRAYRMLQENKQLFPNFMENNKSLSIIHALADSLPSWIRQLLGIKGSIAQATTDIKLLADKAYKENNMFKDEIVAIYSYILFYVNHEKEEAFRLFDTYQCNHKTNPLIAFLKATFTQKQGNTPQAIKILDERPLGAAYLNFYYLDYIYGKYKLFNLEKDADKHIIVFLTHFKGRHYIKEAHQKMAWYHLVIKNNKSDYRKYMQMVEKKGFALIDEDKQALKEAKNKNPIDAILLKARLLYDGGFLTKAQNLLLTNSNRYTSNLNHDGEYYYRMGRISDDLKNYKVALNYYDVTLKKSDPNKYFACSAALYAAMIHEQNKHLKSAEEYYNKCLSLNPSEYATSLHQKAKTGLQRIRQNKR